MMHDRSQDQNCGNILCSRKKSKKSEWELTAVIDFESAVFADHRLLANREEAPWSHLRKLALVIRDQWLIGRFSAGVGWPVCEFFELTEYHWKLVASLKEAGILPKEWQGNPVPESPFSDESSGSSSGGSFDGDA